MTFGTVEMDNFYQSLVSILKCFRLNVESFIHSSYISQTCVVHITYSHWIVCLCSLCRSVKSTNTPAWFLDQFIYNYFFKDVSYYSRKSHVASTNLHSYLKADVHYSRYIVTCTHAVKKQLSEKFWKIYLQEKGSINLHLEKLIN